MGLQLEIHIGYVYGRKEPPAHASKYTPKFVPGARLPHAWIRMKNSSSQSAIDVSYVKEFSQQDIENRKYSTLDLCPFDKFTLVVGSRTEWADRFRDLRSSMEAYGVQVSCRAAGEDFDFVDQKVADLYISKARLGSGGGLLVRPDQHILQVLDSDDGPEELGTAVLRHLGH